MPTKKKSLNWSVRGIHVGGPRRMGGPPARNDVPLLVGPRKVRSPAKKRPPSTPGKNLKNTRK